MAKPKNTPKPFEVKPKAAPPKVPVAPVAKSHAFRETVESIVIAFVLAFLFRTFEAEAFVIPTGSMAPTLMGRHKDVECPKCGYRYQVTASDEETDDPIRRPVSDCIAGMCPMCRYVLPMTPKLPGAQPGDTAHIPFRPSYNGDRILVNKYLYAFTDPQRWDVVVFKYPGEAKMNYIKRLVGLPGEILRIFQGDIFINPPGSSSDATFAIERKPPDKLFAMRQLVHDTDHDPAELDAAGWPLRWHGEADGASTWKLEKTTSGKNVQQQYSVDAKGDTTSWLRYEHLVPTYDVWQQIAAAQIAVDSREPQQPFANSDRGRWRQLITDANGYNGRIDRIRYPGRLQVDPTKTGLHWVGDLMLEADVNVESDSGELILDLVEGGRHFTCTIDLKTGDAKLTAADLADYAPKAATSVNGPGTYHLAFANFDDQLMLWVDGSLVSFEGGTAYDVDKIFGQREEILPQTSAKDLGDLAPVGIGARDAKLSVSRLQVWRDIYYIAASWDRTRPGETPTDWNSRFREGEGMVNIASNPSLWGLFRERDSVDFPIADTQLFVMGDNSAESSDARLWFGAGEHQAAHPGGAYLDKRLLIGKALSVYWPHSWNRIPGTPIPFPLFPNVGDMRLVR